jgi:hypothetical protein
MKPKFTPEFIKEKQFEISERYWLSDQGLSDDEWMISWCLEEIVERDQCIKDLKNAIMYYQMECPDLVEIYQSSKKQK